MTMQNNKIIPFHYQPAQPVKVVHYDYSALSEGDISNLRCMASVSQFLTKRQQERINSIKTPIKAS